MQTNNIKIIYNTKANRYLGNRLFNENSLHILKNNNFSIVVGGSVHC